MTEHEQRHAAYLEQVRAKYSADQLKALQAKGHTFPGGTSYPIDDDDDLDKAVQAVGRGGAEHDAIRKYVAARAKAMGKADKIPETWNADGSLTDAKSREPEGETRDAPTPEDYGIAHGLRESKMLLAGVKAKQLADPDYKTDPDDTAVMKHIEGAEKELDKAIVAQSKDGHEDTPERSVNWATAKRAGFMSLVEQPPAHTAEIQVRMGAEADGHIAHFVGFPSPTGVAYAVSDWLGEYEERMQPGAWAKTITERGNVPMLYNHDDSQPPLASTASGTSELSEVAKGLRNAAEFDRRDQFSNSICVQCERGVLKDMSVSFRAIKEAWNNTYDKRDVTEAMLYDTSIVTYPANPTASGGLVDAMRSALGREGRSLWLSDSEMSVRSALPVIVERQALPDDSDDLIEKALRALAHADEVVSRTSGPHGRARTFLVAQTMLELRAGKMLSSKNEGLLKQALDALGAADKAHSKMANSHAEAVEKVSSVLANSNAGASDDGQNSQVPPGVQENPISPKDGAGPRAQNPYALARARERERAQLRRR